LDVYTEAFVLIWSLGIHLHENVCYLLSNALVSKSLQLPFSYPWTHLFNTQLWFVSKNRISIETCLPVRFLETAYMSPYEYIQDQRTNIFLRKVIVAFYRVRVYKNLALNTILRRTNILFNLIFYFFKVLVNVIPLPKSTFPMYSLTSDILTKILHIFLIIP
jgi:hypothetical protein